jgi:hypothetical protein
MVSFLERLAENAKLSKSLEFAPLEVCAIGILIWLHAKWRRSRNVNR